jgi:RNA recognition motif-containing protein
MVFFAANNSRLYLLVLLLGISCRTQAWVSTAASRSVQRLSSTTSLSAERRFAQHQPNQYAGDGKLAEMNKRRVQTAGRVGTKRFVDPCKVFIGNLPFDVDEKKLTAHILNTMGQSKIIMKPAKIIREWKTGKSKGYGFAVFSDPMYATVCMESVNGKKLEGRALTVDQGKKKEQDNQLYLKKKKMVPVDEEEAVIAEALDEAENDDEAEDEEENPYLHTFDDDIELDAVLFGLQDDDDDDDIDGIFLEKHFKYEEVDPNLNREQRREAQKKSKRKKKATTGFG